MNNIQFTLASADRIQEAQSIASESSQPTLEPVHLLLSILQAPESINHELLRIAGVDESILLAQAKKVADSLPKVTGSDSQMRASSELTKVLQSASDTAKKMGDAYVTEEHLMLALIEKASSLTQ